MIDAAVTPATVWHAWSWPPVVVGALVASALLYGRGVRGLWREAGPGRGTRRLEAYAFASGLGVLVLALLSPLHEMGEALFSAHMAQHELLMVVAAPLLVIGRLLVPMLWGLPMRWRRRVGAVGHVAPLRRAWRWSTGPFVAWSIHAVAIWAWHAPRLFQATLTSDLVHTAQHVSFLGSALLFWWALLHGRDGRLGYGAAVLYVFTTAIHTTALGALLTMARAPWYPAYASTAPAWGFTALEDQQLGGLIMWVPAGVIYTGAALLLFALFMRETDVRAARATHRLTVMASDPGSR